MMRQKPTTRALRANCSLLCITKSNPTNPHNGQVVGSGGRRVCRSPTTAEFAASGTVCPQLPATDPGFQVLEEKKCEEKSPALVITKSTNCRPQMDEDEGHPWSKSERYGVSDHFPRRKFGISSLNPLFKQGEICFPVAAILIPYTSRQGRSSGRPARVPSRHVTVPMKALASHRPCGSLGCSGKGSLRP